MIARLRATVDRLRTVWKERIEPTLPVRAWERYGDLRGDRLAGAASFYGFVSLFPLLLLSAAIASQVAGTTGVETVQDLVDENFPELGLDVGQFYRRAGAVSLVSALILLYSGLRWVDAVRAAVRSMWGMDDKPGNIFSRKLFDTAALLGLGLLIAMSWGTSVVVRRMAAQLLDWFGVEGSGAAPVLEIISWLLSVMVNTALFAYLLAGLPRIVVPPRQQALTALSGAVVYEVLKTFLVEYVVGPANDNRYAAFATPLAVIAWIYLVTRLLMVLAALTAESAIDHLEEEERADRASGAHVPEDEVSAQGAEARAAPRAGRRGREHASRPGAVVEVRATRPSVVFTPSARQARGVGIAAGAVLGAVATGTATLAVWAARTVRSAVRSRTGDRDG